MSLPPSFSDKIVETYDGKFIFTVTLEGVAFIKVWTKSLPEGKIFKVSMIRHSKFILVDNDGRTWIYYPLYKTHELQFKHFWSFPCQIICKIKRIHLSCLWCPYRRILTKGAPNPVKCHIYLDVIPDNRPWTGLRKFLLKNLTSLKEFIAHW